jgi:hypothetical protein
MDDDAVPGIARALATNRALRFVDLQGNALTGDGVTALADVIGCAAPARASSKPSRARASRASENLLSLRVANELLQPTSLEAAQVGRATAHVASRHVASRLRSQLDVALTMNRRMFWSMHGSLARLYHQGGEVRRCARPPFRPCRARSAGGGQHPHGAAPALLNRVPRAALAHQPRRPLIGERARLLLRPCARRAPGGPPSALGRVGAGARRAPRCSHCCPLKALRTACAATH